MGSEGREKGPSVRRLTTALMASTIIATIMLVTVASRPASAGCGECNAYPSCVPDIWVGNTSVIAGQDIVVSGSDWCPGCTVNVFFNGVLVATVIAGPDGTWSVTITIPPGTPPGTYKITATGLASDCECTKTPARTIVVSAQGETRGGSLAFTGGDFLPWLLLLGALVIAGIVLLVAARRHAARAKAQE